LGEDHALRGKPVQVGGADHVVACKTQVVGPQLVGDQDEHVRAARLCGGHTGFRIIERTLVRCSANSLRARELIWSRGDGRSMSITSRTRAGFAPSTTTRSER